MRVREAERHYVSMSIVAIAGMLANHDWRTAASVCDDLLERRRLTESQRQGVVGQKAVATAHLP